MKNNKQLAEHSYDQHDKSESYKALPRVETPPSISEKLYFWSNNNIMNYLNASKLVQIVTNINNHKDRFKYLSIKYDEERDNEFTELQYEFNKGDLS